MKRKTIFIIIFVLVNVAIFIGLRYWRAQKQRNADEVVKIAQRYAGATGLSIETYDKNISRWLAEMEEESIEVILRKLTDAAEWECGIHDAPIHPGGTPFKPNEEERERIYHRIDIETILSHRRFRKAYEDLQKVGAKKAAVLLTRNIKENVAELRKEFQKNKDEVSRGEHKGGRIRVTSYSVNGHYRNISPPDKPPTLLGRRFGVLTYIWLAALLELREVRPAVEEAIQLAKEEYWLYNSIDVEIETIDFKLMIIGQWLYNPSLLVTATLCDPTWNVEGKKRLEEKLVNREIVDWNARSTEYNWHGREGWVPIIPHEKMLKTRYYQGITDAEFNDFFSK